MTKHTPYDGASTPFAIGLKPLDLADWIELDETYDAQMAEKLRLYKTVGDKVFVAQPDTESAQQEVLDLLSAHMLAHYPDRFKQTADGVAATGDPALVAGARDKPPLHKASLLVQEDLILMRHGQTGWRLAAGSLCFPSSWTLTEKFGLPMHAIHQPVPDFGKGTRNDELINRMFDRLHQPVQRFNWSIQAGGALYHPLSNEGRQDRTDHPSPRFGDDVDAAAFVRVERQTLRKLPQSRDVLFTIRIYLNPLGWIARQPERVRLAQGFAGQLRAMPREQLDYKGLTADRDRIVAALDAMATDEN